MALIKCSECGKEISDKAGTCVHCGCPITKEKHSIRKGTMMCTNCKSIFYEIYEQCPKCGSSNKITANPGENLPNAQPVGQKKKWTTSHTICLVGIILFLVILVQYGARSPSGSKWYVGGTLHKATISEWNKASYSNKLATAADWVVNISPRIKAKVQRSGSMDALRSYAAELVTCVNETAAGEGYSNMKAGEIAVSCGVIMGWTR